MKEAIRIEAKISKQGAKALAKGITDIFIIGHDKHMDQDTIRHALDILAKGASIDGASITNCSFMSKDKI